MGLGVQKSSPFAPIEDLLKRWLVHVLEMIFSREEISPKDFKPTEINSILVVRQHDQLGDFLLATPVLRALREHFPKVRIGTLVREYYQDIARAVPYVDEVLVVAEKMNRWNFEKARTLWRQLRKGWDLAVVLNTVSHSLTSDLLAQLSGSRYVLGSSDKILPGCSRNFLYNLIAPRNPAAIHQTEINLNIVRYIGVNTQDRTECIVVNSHVKQKARERFNESAIDRQTPIVGMHIGAGKPPNRWSAENFGRLARVLHDRNNVNVVVFWGPKEHALLGEFNLSAGAVSIKIEPASLPELAAYFSVCDVIVCNDTGVLHVAAATGTPVVALFGPTDPTEWMPIGSQHSFIRGAEGNIDAIAVEEVVSAVGRSLSKIEMTKKLSV